MAARRLHPHGRIANSLRSAIAVIVAAMCGNFPASECQSFDELAMITPFAFSTNMPCAGTKLAAVFLRYCYRSDRRSKVRA
jgi:hypothetical protein